MDKQGEGGRDPVDIDISGLDEDAIKNWWDNQDQGNFSAFNNCSDIVSKALRKGGFPMPFHFIHHPTQIYNDIKRILDRGWPN